MSDETRASDEGTRWQLDIDWYRLYDTQSNNVEYDLESSISDRLKLATDLNALEQQLRDLRAENERLTAERDEAARWREVVLDALVTHWEFRGEHESDAHMAVADLMAAGSRWALDPAISEDAAKLRDTYAGALALANADAKALATRLETAGPSYDHVPEDKYINWWEGKRADLANHHARITPPKETK